jgi:hypothetical protein
MTGELSKKLYSIELVSCTGLGCICDDVVLYGEFFKRERGALDIARYRVTHGVLLTDSIWH